MHFMLCYFMPVTVSIHIFFILNQFSLSHIFFYLHNHMSNINFPNTPHNIVHINYLEKPIYQMENSSYYNSFLFFLSVIENKNLFSCFKRIIIFTIVYVYRNLKRSEKKNIFQLYSYMF